MKASAKNGGKTLLLGGVGGLLAAGLKMFIDPALFKDNATIVKRCWITPAIEAVIGGVGGAFDATALAGAGVSGAAVAHLVENVGLAISIKKNQQNTQNAPAPAATSGYETAALVMPRELAASTGAMFGAPQMAVGAYDDTGALVMPSHAAYRG